GRIPARGMAGGAGKGGAELSWLWFVAGMVTGDLIGVIVTAACCFRQEDLRESREMEARK
ncbi:MAG: hypothetical protein ILO68_05650, partial [Clostridia bacterium]|nr:hypothetical protein [Clostridia bacterium]